MNIKIDTSHQAFLKIVEEAAPELLSFYQNLPYKAVEESGEYMIIDDNVVIVEEEFFVLPKISQNTFLRAETDMNNMLSALEKKRACEL